MNDAIDCALDVFNSILNRLIEDPEGFFKEVKERIESSPELRSMVNTLISNQKEFLEKSPDEQKNIFSNELNKVYKRMNFLNPEDIFYIKDKKNESEVSE